MSNKKFAIIALTLMLFSVSINLISAEKTTEYDESIILTVKYYNYLENISEYTNHDFLIKINSSSNPFESCLNVSGRHNKTNFLIDINSSSNRYIKIVFEVYEIIEDNLFKCDIDRKAGIGGAEIIYDSYTGFWTGDDQIGDSSGNGRFNGCDDKSYNSFERDFELCFSIDIKDTDSDGIPKWYEENILHTDPLVDNSKEDYDNDSIPLYWEYKWGYDPFIYDDHKEIDLEEDGLNNYEEYLTSEWNSDPYTQDIFIELDQMERGPAENNVFLSNNSINMVYQTYAKRNIVFHVDDGCMGGGETLPFDNMVWFGEEKKYYEKYFLHNKPNNWRRGVFRYTLYVYDTFPIKGLEFPGENSIINFLKPGLNSYVISKKAFQNSSDLKNACIMLHELGHTLGIVMGRPLGCDNQLMRFPFSLQKIIFKNYKSVMNYQYCHHLLDYSDGSHGIFDSDDWEKIDLTYFQPKGAQ